MLWNVLSIGAGSSGASGPKIYSIKITNRIITESLILAQDERWRRG